MSTISTKHRRKVTVGDDSDDDDGPVRVALVDPKLDTSSRNASHLSFGKPDGEAMTTTARHDFASRSHADVEPRSTRDARSRYMNSKHFELGFDTTPIQSQSQGAYGPPPRSMLNRPEGRPKGSQNDKNASSLFISNHDRGAWVDDIESSSRVDFVAPTGSGQYAKDKEAIIRNHRSNHFDFGTDKMEYTTTAGASFPHSDKPVPRTAPIKVGASAVQLGSADHNWKVDLVSTAQQNFTKPVMSQDDSLTDFVKQGPSLRFGDDKHRMTTEARRSFKQTQFMPQSSLKSEDIARLKIKPTQLPPSQKSLGFTATGAFKNALGQTLDE